MMVVLAAHWNEIVALANADPDAQGDWLLAFVFAGPILAILLSMTLVVTAMPAAVGVLIAEAFAIRSWMFHALNGGLSAWIGWSIMQDAQDQYRFLTEPQDDGGGRPRGRARLLADRRLERRVLEAGVRARTRAGLA